MMLASRYSEFPTSPEDEQDTRIAPDPKVIRNFTRCLHRLAEGLDGELVLVAIEQKPDQRTVAEAT